MKTVEITNSDKTLSKSPVDVSAGSDISLMKYLSFELVISCPSRNQ